MRRVRASCTVKKKSGAWMLIRRKALPVPLTPRTPRIIKGHVVRGDIRKIIIKIHGARRAKLA